MSKIQKKPVFTKPELSVEDLTWALHQSNIKLSETNRRLMESEKKQSELLANLSHDFRSPLTTLRGYIEYLLSFDHLEESEVFSTLNQMNNKMCSLDYLMNQLLLITTLDSSEKPVDLEPIQIGRYLRDFYYSCEIDKKYSLRELTLKVPADFTPMVLIDIGMFARVLDNLFTNALKYSSQGDKIILDASLRENDVVISISDTGIGIEQQHLQRIFERTYMISDSRTPDSAKGCGLGLTITSSIMEKHNGQIWCESTPGIGSTFFLSLPVFGPVASNSPF